MFSLFDVANKANNFHHYFYAYGMLIRKDHIALYYLMVISASSVWTSTANPFFGFCSKKPANSHEYQEKRVDIFLSTLHGGSGGIRTHEPVKAT